MKPLKDQTGRCDQCRLWDRLPRGDDGVKGMCRIQPHPVVMRDPITDAQEVRTAWPTTGPAEWCGNFTAKN